MGSPSDRVHPLRTAVRHLASERHFGQFERVRGSEVVDLLHALDAHGVEGIVEGGWGVDALVGHELRSHKDVDLVVRLSDVPTLLEVLEERGFRLAGGAPPNGFVCKTASGSAVDVRPVTFDADGRARYRAESGDEHVYAADAFGAHGIIEGTAVRCLTPAAQMLTHLGYE